MHDVSILVVDNDERWLLTVGRLLSGLGKVDVAESLEKALALIRQHSFDLAIVDLSLLGDPADASQSDELGMDLLGPLRLESPYCQVIVLTGYPTAPRTRTALRTHGAFDFIEKGKFGDGSVLPLTAHRALFAACLDRAAARSNSACTLTVNFDETSLLGCELVTRKWHATFTEGKPQPISVARLATVQRSVKRARGSVRADARSGRSPGTHA
jgi:ActR/RegA family two-component response regulator